MVHRTSCGSIYFDTNVSQGELCLTSIWVFFFLSAILCSTFLILFVFPFHWFLVSVWEIVSRAERDTGLTAAAFIRILVETNERAMREKTASGKGWELGKKECSTGFRPDRDRWKCRSLMGVHCA